MKVGDKVCLVRHMTEEDFWRGWARKWTEEEGLVIGNTYTVREADLNLNGFPIIKVDASAYWVDACCFVIVQRDVSPMTIDFIPFMENDPIVSVEYRYVVLEDDGGINSFPPEEPTIKPVAGWSVYIRHLDGDAALLRCVADLETEEQAASCCAMLKSLLKLK